MGDQELARIKYAISKGEEFRDEIVSIIEKSSMTYSPNTPGIITGGGQYRISFSGVDKEYIKTLKTPCTMWLVVVKNIYKDYGLKSGYCEQCEKIEEIFEDNPRGRSIEAMKVAAKFKNDFNKIIEDLNSAVIDANLRREPQPIENMNYITFIGDINDSNISIGNIKSAINQTIQQTSNNKEEMKALLDEVINELPNIESSGLVDKGILKKISKYFERNNESCTQLALAIAHALMKWATT